MNLPIGARLFQAAFGSCQTCHSVLDRTPAREKNNRAVVRGSQSGSWNILRAMLRLVLLPFVYPASPKSDPR